MIGVSGSNMVHLDRTLWCWKVLQLGENNTSPILTIGAWIPGDSATADSSLARAA